MRVIEKAHWKPPEPNARVFESHKPFMMKGSSGPIHAHRQKVHPIWVAAEVPKTAFAPLSKSTSDLKLFELQTNIWVSVC